MSRTIFAILAAGSFLLLNPAFAVTPIPTDPIYIRIDNGWKGLYAHNDEYAEYSLVGSEIKLQDSYHILLKPGLGLMVTFADKKEFATGKDLLELHRQWEIEYWRKHASKVESTSRDDLGGARQDIKVTELTLYNKEGKQLKVCLIGLASKEGVFVFSISPANEGIDLIVKKLVSSIKVVHTRLDAQESAKQSKFAAGIK